MIRLLKPPNYARAYAFYNANRAAHVYHLASLKRYGLTRGPTVFYGLFAKTGPLVCVCMRLNDVAVLASYAFEGNMWPQQTRSGWARELAGLLNKEGRMQEISGPSALISALSPLLKADYRRINSVYAVLGADFTPSGSVDAVIRPIRADELDAVYGILSASRNDGLFVSSYEKYLSSSVQKLREGTGRIYVAERDGEIVSTAATNAEIEDFALVGGVATLPAHRRKGLGSAVVTELCRSLLSEGRTPTLGYADETAGRVYRALGFLPTGRVTLLKG